MKLLSINASRSLWLFKINDLSPLGQARPTLLQELYERYKFQVMPNATQIIDFATKKQALSFKTGFFKWSGGEAGISVDLHNDGLVVDSRAGTEAGDAFLVDLTSWLHKVCKMVDIKTLSVQKAYVSEVYVSMPHSLSIINPKLSRFAEMLTSESTPQGLKFEVLGIGFGSDPILKAVHPAFSVIFFTVSSTIWRLPLIMLKREYSLVK